MYSHILTAINRRKLSTYRLAPLTCCLVCLFSQFSYAFIIISITIKERNEINRRRDSFTVQKEGILMKKTVRILCVLLLLTGCSSPAKDSTKQNGKTAGAGKSKIAAPADIHYPKSPSIEDHDAQIAIVDDNPVDGTLLSGYADFSQESFSAILKTASDNVSYSPLSLYYPLMMTLQASEGQTAEQLQTLLHVDGRDSAKNMGNLYRRLYTDNESGQLKIANSLWIQNSYPVNKDFIETANKQFLCQLPMMWIFHRQRLRTLWLRGFVSTPMEICPPL